MKVRLPDNPTELISWNPKISDYPMKPKGVSRSNIQYEIGQKIKEKYPLDPILEDVTLPKSRMSLDFFLPNRMTAFEIQGRQHDEKNDFFHKKVKDFNSQQERDNFKRRFCEINGIRLFEVRSVEEMKRIF